MRCLQQKGANAPPAVTLSAPLDSTGLVMGPRAKSLVVRVHSSSAMQCDLKSPQRDPSVAPLPQDDEREWY